MIEKFDSFPFIVLPTAMVSTIVAFPGTKPAMCSKRMPPAYRVPVLPTTVQFRTTQSWFAPRMPMPPPDPLPPMRLPTTRHASTSTGPSVSSAPMPAP